MWAPYQWHYAYVPCRVPAECLWEIELKELDYGLLDAVSGKNVPDWPFPCLDKPRTLSRQFRKLHVRTLKARPLKGFGSCSRVGYHHGLWGGNNHESYLGRYIHCTYERYLLGGWI